MWKSGQLTVGYWSMASLLNFLISLYKLTLPLWICCLRNWLASFSPPFVFLWPFLSLWLSLTGYHHREKRQAHDHKKNTCPLLLVADYRFFKHMGRGQESVTLNYLVCCHDAMYKTLWSAETFRDSSFPFKWCCMKHLYIVSVLPTVDDGRHDPILEKKPAVPVEEAK